MVCQLILLVQSVEDLPKVSLCRFKGAGVVVPIHKMKNSVSDNIS